MLKQLRALPFRWVISKGGLFSLALALMFTIGALTVSEISNRALLESSLWIFRSQRTVSELHELHKLLLNIEIGQKGYLITGRREYLQAYERATTAIGPALSRLRQEAGSDADEQDYLDRLERL